MKTFEEYLHSQRAPRHDGSGDYKVIDFGFRVCERDGRTYFYVHPAGVSGETTDFWLDGNILTPGSHLTTL